jgi:hypothetical protein
LVSIREFLEVAKKLLTSLPTEIVKECIIIIIIIIIIHYVLRSLKLYLFLAVVVYTSRGPSIH